MNRHRNNRLRLLPGALRSPFAVVLLSIWLAGLAGPSPAAGASGKSVFEWSFTRLEYIRDDRVVQLQRLCDRVHRRARAIQTDKVMAAFFDACCEYAAVQGTDAPPPAELAATLAKVRKAAQAHYVAHYIDFHDLLFVDAGGDVVFSIRRNPAYAANLFAGPLAATLLVRRLTAAKQRPDERFVDFHPFAAAGEPAGFFIEPVRRHGVHRGWFVLQWSLNKINALFAGSEALGPSGETILVNRDGVMLTESSFCSDSTILKQHLDESNVEAKFKSGKGRRTVTDYRGATALTAFEVFEFLGARWLVVAKVDEAQVLTTHFMQHPRYYHEAVAAHLQQHRQKCDARAAAARGRKTLRVDMDEFQRAHRGELLRTYGVSTCTALIAACPGKFGYLAHVSPYDRVYGGTATNLVGHVLKKIKTYDIYKYERGEVRFAIVATHLESLPQIVDKLLEEGFYLSQIRVFHRPDAASADVVYDYPAGRTVVEWRSNGPEGRSFFQSDCGAANLGAILKQAL